MTESIHEMPTTVVWDPRNPAKLLIPTVDDAASASQEAGDNDRIQMDFFVSDAGVEKCNPFEISALMELLDARDTYLEDTATSNNRDEALLSLSASYQKALSDCIDRWEESLDEKSSITEKTNMELMKNVYAVAQLSETFLLTTSNDLAMDFYQSTTNLPGAVTADTIRYLRHHHVGDAADFLNDEEYEELMSSVQPELVGDGTVYWRLLENYVVRGCLEDAWSLLTRHSMCRRSNDEAYYRSLGAYDIAKLEEDRAGFEAMGSLLKSAPLPGGRTDNFDKGFDVEQVEESNDDEELINGIPSTAYRLWESGKNKAGGISGDYPMAYQPHAAKQMFDDWQQTVRNLPEVDKLKLKIPQLQRILAMLNGDFSQVEFDAWTDELCGELLYKIPNLRLDDMHVRAKHIMEKYADVSSESVAGSYYNEAILNVMKGDSSKVIQIVHAMGGGGSGAALPAVMTFLLCRLLDDVRMMPGSDSNENSLTTKLLLNGAFAVRASLATEGKHDLGTLLTVRLLVPYIKSGEDVEIAAALENTLEHHAPEDDAEANTILSLCRNLVERKNVRVLDGCVCIILARYRYFLRDGRPGGAVHWLTAGIDFESQVLCDGPKRSGQWQEDLYPGECYRLLVSYFNETAQKILPCLLGEQEHGSSYATGAMQMVAAAEDESDITSFIPAVKLLQHVVAMAEAVRERNIVIVASSIISCLEERANGDEAGVVSALARPTMHWNLLRLAKWALDQNEQQDRLHEQQSYSAPFDVRGMQVLMERFATIVAAREMEKAKPLSEADATSMKLTLANGLMRAFVAENASKKDNYRTGRKVSVDGIYSSNLGSYSREKQEMVVQNMLGDF